MFSLSDMETLLIISIGVLWILWLILPGAKDFSSRLALTAIVAIWLTGAYIYECDENENEAEGRNMDLHDKANDKWARFPSVKRWKD